MLPLPSHLASLLVLALAALPAASQAPHVRRLDVAPDGQPGDADALGARVTSDGGEVLFQSRAQNLLPALAPGSGSRNLFVVDVRTGAIEQVNLGSAGQALAIGFGIEWALSADGRYVVFQATGDDAALGDANGAGDLYLRDRSLGTTELLTGGVAGTVPFATATRPLISEDGDRVLFGVNGAQLLPGVPSTGPFVLRLYLHERSSGLTTQLGPLHPPHTYDDDVRAFALSGDGRWAAFSYLNQPLGIPPTLRVLDLDTGTHVDHPLHFDSLELDRGGATLVGASPDGLVAGDQDGLMDVYRIDPQTGSVSHASNLPPGPWGEVPVGDPRLSPDGRYVCFSGKDYLGAFGSVGTFQSGQVFVHDLFTGLTTLGSISDQAVPGGNPTKTWGSTALNGDLSELGEYLVYTSNYLNLAKPSGEAFGLFVLDRRTAGPQLMVTGLQAGSTASLTVTDAVPGGAVLLGISTTGQGPQPSYWGALHLSAPIHFVHLPVDAAGEVSVGLPLAAGLAGTALHAQGLDILGYAPTTPYFGVVQ
ncbi:MAG: hypothetical protein P1V81_17100 [Planctomycetota bacterium]|nr:hypothetical protein [Planctomycetota bacterium]